MELYSRHINQLIEQFAKLPGVGNKSAGRLALHIINMPVEHVERFANVMVDARKNIHYCNICYTLTDSETCPICRNEKRDHSTIMVVENIRDLAAYERTGKFDGVYHVLHGAISSGSTASSESVTLSSSRLPETTTSTAPADGSMRDALSLLDQCIAFHFGEELTYDKVLDVLGAVDTDVFARLLGFIIEKNVIGCISLLEEVVMQGRDLAQFTADMMWYLRNLLLAKTSDGDIEDVIDISSEGIIRLKEAARLIEAEEIMRQIRIFSELSSQIKYASQKRILIEMTLIKLCKPAMETTNDAVVARVRDLEEKIEKGIVQTAPAAIQSAYGAADDSAKPVKKPELPKAIPADIENIVKNWHGIVSDAPMPLKAHLKKVRLSLAGDNRLMIVAVDGHGSDSISTPQHHKYIEDMLSNFLQKEVSVEIKSMEKGSRFEEHYVDLAQIFNNEIDFEIEEED